MITNILVSLWISTNLYFVVRMGLDLWQLARGVKP